MKKVLLILVFLGLQHMLAAQDRIVKVSGEEIAARVLEITLHDVLYQHPDSLQGLVWRLPKSEVFMVKFENGAKEVFEQHMADDLTYAGSSMSPDQLYALGRQEANMFYKGNGAMWGSAASAMVMFPLGLAGSVIIGATPPKVKTTQVSDVRLLSEQSFMVGYKEQAHRKKKNKALAGAGIATGVQLSLLLLFLASLGR